jgi:hypothetical protein
MVLEGARLDWTSLAAQLTERVHMELGNKFVNSLRFKTQVLESCTMSVVDFAARSQ